MDSELVSVTPIVQPLLTSTDLATINAARDVLDKINEDARQKSNTAPVYNGMEANCGDYARISERAAVAADSLFDLLNLTNATRAQEIPDAIMHRRYDS